MTMRLVAVLVRQYVPCLECCCRPRDRVGDDNEFELPYEYAALDEDEGMEMCVSPIRSPISTDLSTQADSILKILVLLPRITFPPACFC